MELIVTDMDALPGHSIGLMVRAPIRDGLGAAGPGQDWVTLGIAGENAQITWASTDGGVTTGGEETQAAPGLAQPEATLLEKIGLRILRNGSVLANDSQLRLYYRVGEASDWTEIEASPLERTDIDSYELEVGIFQTSEVEATAVVDALSIQNEKVFQSGFE